MEHMTDDQYDVMNVTGKKDFLRSFVAFNIVMEGIWFYSGFMVMHSCRQRNKLRNFGSMINWALITKIYISKRNFNQMLLLANLGYPHYALAFGGTGSSLRNGGK